MFNGIFYCKHNGERVLEKLEIGEADFYFGV